MIGKLVHAVQSDERSYYEAYRIIRFAEDEGIFKGVVIMPEREYECAVCGVTSKEKMCGNCSGQPSKTSDAAFNNLQQNSLEKLHKTL